MNIVQRFINNIAWYLPSNDSYSWQYFYNNCYNIDYSDPNAEQLKRVAWISSQLQTSGDVGMWADRQARLFKFLAADIALSGFDSLEAEAIQYEFVACFLNDYNSAAHNNDLWQSVNDSAAGVLADNIIPQDVNNQIMRSVLSPNQLPVNPRWLLTAIPLILYNAFKTINLSYYRPTEDSDTWSYFQNVVFDMSVLPYFQFTYRHTYLLNNINSTVDSGMWQTLASAATSFLNANLGAPPANAAEQVQLAINFCGLFAFNYNRAAHNADLFQAYNEAFANAAQSLSLLKPPLEKEPLAQAKPFAILV